MDKAVPEKVRAKLFRRAETPRAMEFTPRDLTLLAHVARHRFLTSTQLAALDGGSPQGVDLRLEVVTLPVADVDRAKRFYEGLGWRLDADITRGDDFRVVQFTPRHSVCSIHFGKGLTAAEPGVLQEITTRLPGR